MLDLESFHFSKPDLLAKHDQVFPRGMQVFNCPRMIALIFIALGPAVCVSHFHCLIPSFRVVRGGS